MQAPARSRGGTPPCWRCLRQGKGENLVRSWPPGGEEIQAVEALVDRAGRTDAALIPAVADPALLPDPSPTRPPARPRSSLRLAGGQALRDREILAPKLDLGLRVR